MTSTDTNAHPVAHTHAYILLDRTGSMSNIWAEALGSVNAYVEALTKPADGAKPSGDDKVTLAVFDIDAPGPDEAAVAENALGYLRSKGIDPA